MNRIPVAISACLTGATVRHDGGHKRSRYCTDVLEDYFDLKPVCPESEAGLGIPRPAMHLVENQHGDPRLHIIRSGKDVTEPLEQWVHAALPGLANMRGIILAAKSPSCGMERVRVYNDEGHVARRDEAGIFARLLLQRYPLMPAEENGRLEDPRLRENFIERVFLYDEWCSMRERGLTRAALLAFHTEHKYQLLAHCQATYGRLGPMLSDLRVQPLEQLADTYIREFMEGMRKPISRGAHANVMQHLMGFFRGKLDAVDRDTLQATINDYLAGQVPLVVPMTLLRAAGRKFPHPWVAKQRYLSPYPDALGLRNHL